MKGSLTQFFYPRLRDSLHRRTIIVAEGCGAVSARSLANQQESYYTLFCSEENIVTICLREVKDIIKLCRPSVRYHPSSDLDDMLSCVERHVAIDDDEVNRVSSLSIPTMPKELTDRMLRRSGAPIIQKLAKSYIRRASVREHTLKNHTVDEMMLLADPETVLTGRAVILGSGIKPELEMFYTPQEYCLHLRRIYELMEKYNNYSVVLVKRQMVEDWAIHSKGSNDVLVIRDNPSMSVCEIIERPLAATFCDYIRTISEREHRKCDRQSTMLKIREMINILSV